VIVRSQTFQQFSEAQVCRTGGLVYRTISRSTVPELHPGNLLSDTVAAGQIVGSDSHVWWIAHTRPRQEKAVARSLFARDVAFYLPLIARKSLSRSRTRIARIVLFPGYIFICGGEEDRLLALKTNRVVTVRSVHEGAELRRDLSRFAELIALGAPLLPEARLAIGERVRVKGGPFRDMEGTVIRRDGKTRLLIAVNCLQQGASLEIDDCWLESV
jgi:transcription antitermination factor NusG